MKGLHLLSRAGSCIALAGTEHLVGPQVNAVDTHSRNRPAFSDFSGIATSDCSYLADRKWVGGTFFDEH